MVGKDAQGRRFASVLGQASDGWRMLAVCLIGQALDDIAPRDGRSISWGRQADERVDMAILWIEGAPADLSSSVACRLAKIDTELLRSEAQHRLSLRVKHAPRVSRWKAGAA